MRLIRRSPNGCWAMRCAPHIDATDNARGEIQNYFSAACFSGAGLSRRHGLDAHQNVTFSTAPTLKGFQTWNAVSGKTLTIGVPLTTTGSGTSLKFATDTKKTKQAFHFSILVFGAVNSNSP